MRKPPRHILDIAVKRAACQKSGWTGWRLRRWLGSSCVTDGGTILYPFLHAEIIKQYNHLLSRKKGLAR